jgi:tripartite-type tricarboxylate transporter receptor subunit TctC
VVPRAAGGVVDVVARLWAEEAKQRLGNIIVENQGGGGGLIGATTVAQAKPDGYTLLAGTTSELVITPLITPKPPYDPFKDLAPITIIAESVSALMVHSSLPVRTLAELVAYDRTHPGTLSYGSAGVGTTAHLCAELFKQLAGLPDIVHVPYRGANPGLVDFYAGQLPMFAASISPQVLAMHDRGVIRILMAGSNHRLKGACLQRSPPSARRQGSCEACPQPERATGSRRDLTTGHRSGVKRTRHPHCNRIRSLASRAGR